MAVDALSPDGDGLDGFDTGRRVPFHTARDPINLPVLRRWCDVMGVTNPLYADPDLAARTRFGQVVSPLTMLDVWTKPGLAYVRDTTDPQGSAFEALDRSGYTSAVAVSSELHQARPLALGELLTSTMGLELVSPEKATALGAARFVTTRQDFLVGGEPVGHARFTVMKFRPSGETRSSAPPAPGILAPSGSDDRVDRDATGTVTSHGIGPGHQIPPVRIPISATLIVGGAIATADFFEAHHDRDAAVSKGSRDIFMNIHTTLGLIQRAVGDWLGPDVAWRSISTRLGVPNYPGDTMVVSVTVSSVDPGTGATTIAIKATNSLGTHAEVRAEVDLPG